MFRTSFRTRSGLTLAADVGGDERDPPVLLLHGGRETRHAWGKTCRALVSAGRYVVALDLRGHGESDSAPDGDYRLDTYADDVRDVLDQLEAPAAIAGFLLGGLIALSLAEDRDRVAAIALLDTTLSVSQSRSPESGRILSEVASRGFADLDEAADRLSAVPGFRSRIRSRAEVGRVLREDADGRWRWRFDNAAVVGPAERRVTLSEVGERLAKIAAQSAIPIRAIFTSAVSAADAQSMAADLPRAECVSVASEVASSSEEDAVDGALISFLENVHRRPDGRPASAGVDPSTLRRAMGNFATGVTVVTTVAPDGTPAGLTANSFTSVSLDPPLVLFCLDNRSSNLETFRRGSPFAINVLHIGQQPMSDRFMSKSGDRWKSTAWETWDTGAPILQDAMACFECDPYDCLAAGDHHIVIGKVRRVWFDPGRDPLLYLQGRYRRVHIPD